MNAEELEVEVLIAWNEVEAARKRFQHLLDLRAGGVVQVDAIYMRHHSAVAQLCDSLEDAQEWLRISEQDGDLAPVCVQRGGVLFPAMVGDQEPEREYRPHYLHGLLREAYRS